MVIIVLIAVAAWSLVVLLAFALCKAAARADAGSPQPKAEPVTELAPVPSELSQPPLAGRA
jgi:hypothetical protein